ncbi:MAG: hypothetical protein AAEJ16_07755 [Arenicellales bacterium]
MSFLRKPFLPLGLAIGLSLGQAVEARVQQIEVCYDFSCKTRQQVELSTEEWRSVIGWFYPAATSAAEEREQLRQAVGWMEVIVGRHTPTHRDKGLNLEKNPEFPGQLDCIDESLNITTYMRLFHEQGHLRRHRVVDRAYRTVGFDAHWAGQIEEIETGERFVIDSWFQDNGMLPYISPSTDWLDVTDVRILIFGIQD